MHRKRRTDDHRLRVLRVLWCEVASLAVILTGDVSTGLAGLMLILIPVIGLAEETSPWLGPARVLSSLLAILYLLFFPIDWLVLSDHLVFAVVHLIFYLKIHTLLHLHSEPDRHRYRLYTLCLFEMLASASMTVHLSFFLPVVLFVILGAWVLVLEQALGGRRPGDGKKMHVPAAGTALALGCSVLVLAGVTFVTLPRTAFGGFRLGGVKGITTTGLTGDIQLGDFGTIQISRDVVMRVVGDKGGLAFPQRWRGMAFDRYESGRWKRTRSGTVLLPQRAPGEFLLDRPSTESRTRSEVFLVSLDTDVLFLPPGSLELSVPLPAVYVDPYLTVRTGRRAYAGRRYTVSWRTGAPVDSSSLGGVERLEVETRKLYLQIPPLSEEFDELSRRIVTELPSGLELAGEVETFLKREYGYTLVTPSRRRSDPLEDFLFEARAGHCEFFATAMVMLLRSKGVPSRLVTGFRRGELNEIGMFEVVRRSDAHAWVEVYDERRGWVAFDPTPSSPRPAHAFGMVDFLYQGIDSVRLLWEMYVVAFDSDRQRALWVTLGEGLDVVTLAGHRARGFVRRNAPTIGAAGLLLVGVLVLVRTRRGRAWRTQLGIRWPFRRARLGGRPESAIRFYENLLRKLESAGFSKPPGMTPGEFAESLEDRLPGISELTGMYYDVRYGGADLGTEAEMHAERLAAVVRLTALGVTDLTADAAGPVGEDPLLR